MHLPYPLIHSVTVDSLTMLKKPDGRSKNRLGQRGSHLLRAAFRALPGQLQPVQPAQAAPQASVGRQNNNSPPLGMPSVDLDSLCTPLVSAGTILQSELMMSACKQFYAGAPAKDDAELKICDRLLFTPARPRTSLTAEADGMKTHRTSFRNDLLCAASAVWQLGCGAWGAHLRMLKNRIEAGALKVVAVLKGRVYDETPLKLRVRTADSQQAPWASKSDSCIAKIMQTRYKIGLVVQDTSTGKRLYYRGMVPTLLQGLERTRAEDICLSQRKVLNSIPMLDEITANAKISLDITAADRYLANARAEAGLRLDRPESGQKM